MNDNIADVINNIKNIIGENRDKKSAKIAFYYLLKKTSKKNILLNKNYFVSQWSYTTIYDGIFSYEETIDRYKTFRVQINDDLKKDLKKIKIYYTNTNYRCYLPFDIYDNKQDCILISSFKNSFGYNFDSVCCGFLLENNIE